MSAVGSVDRKGLTAVQLGVRLEEGQYRTSVTPATALSELASEMHVLYNVHVMYIVTGVMKSWSMHSSMVYFGDVITLAHRCFLFP